MVQETKNAWLENNDENYWGYFSIKQLKSSLSRDRGSDRLEYRFNYYYTVDGGEVLLSEISNQDPS